MPLSPFQPRLAFAGAPAFAPRPARVPARRRFGPTAALGNEPPLDVAAPVVPTARHAVSVRWLGASVLTGITGALLLGSAIYVSSQGDLSAVEPAEPAPVGSGRAADSAGGVALKRGDKLVRSETVASAKQTYRMQVTLRSGDREIMKPRAFTRLATGLSLSTGIYATDVPPFNPMRFFASNETERAAAVEPLPETNDAEVSVIKTDLSALILEPAGPTLTDEAAFAQAEAQARADADAAKRAAFPLAGPTFMPARGFGPGAGPARTLPGAVDAAFRGIEVRVVPENVTDLAKASRSAEALFEERTVALKRGDTIESLLRANGAGEEARTVVATLGPREKPVEGLQMRLLFGPGAKPGDAHTVMRATLYGERGIEAIAAMNDRGTFVSVAPPPAETTRGSAEDEEDDDASGAARLYDSLYETLLKHELPKQLVENLIQIFGYDVDLQRRVAAGDSLELIYATDDEPGGERVELQSATLNLGNEVRRVFRYQADDGSVEFLDEGGRSLRKFLIRKPVLDAKMTSGFGNRIHPLLSYGKAHMGVDWATRVGSPIFAAGNGTVISAGWNAGGYGNRIEIQHANGYVTTYNHQSRIGRGIAPGVRVRQGQVIGYVGSTGLSTGPHLHYEVLINGRFVDPMKIRVPRGRELDGRMLADFTRQREQIEAVARRAVTSSPVAVSEAR